MGNGIIYKCKKCNEEYDFYYGVGTLYFASRDKLEKEVKDGKYGEELKQRFEEKPSFHISAEQELYVCPNCHVPKNDFNLSVVEGDGFSDVNNIFFQYVHKCPKCKIEMISYKLSGIDTKSTKYPKDLRCSKCNGKLKKKDGYFLWD
ncbi:MAG: hypothetical protein J5710_15065 [Treponema sp.]|nr:hypothetical protein [Treponema sp.]